jgi:hypothetical protein
MGYRVRPAWIWQRKRYNTFEVIVGVANDGVAAIPGNLRLTLQSRDGKYRESGSLDGGQPRAGKVRQASFILPRDLNRGELKLNAELETKGGVRRPVRWACAQALNSDGSFPIHLKQAGDTGWRKGV